jgi:rhamnogalacturonan endolyase
VNGGPMKQELTVHATTKTPLILKMLQGEHFGASAQTFESPDQKIYGPYFVYLNSAADHAAMITDAKQMAEQEVTLWPYQWMDHPLYPTERTSVSGRINIKNDMSPEGLMVVLAQPGIDIYDQGKEYMFWSKTNVDGDFLIPHVRAGNYTLYAFATNGRITDEFQRDNVVISGNETDLGTITWAPTQYEYLLWQIGQSDRKAGEFKLGNVARRYGLWDDVPPNLTYVVGSSSDANDWYYAQTKPGSWTVQFNLDQSFTGDAVLTIGIAGAANDPLVEVYVNDSKQTTLSFGNDRSVYRSANTGGKHQIKPITFPANLLKTGENTVVFKLLSVGNRGGLMYDVVKLEAGDPVTSVNMTDTDQPEHYYLEQNYPNPFNPVTRITFSISKSALTNLTIYNSLGQEVKTLLNEYMTTGHHQIEFDGSALPSGVYFYQLRSDSFLQVKKMLLIK